MKVTKIGDCLTNSNVFGVPTTHNHLYSDAVCGLGAFVAAAADILRGERIAFAICNRDGASAPIVREILRVGMGEGGDPAEGYNPVAPRYLGERLSADGGGSHALIPSWHGPACEDRASIAVALALSCGRDAYRLPNIPLDIAPAGGAK